jgi:hypothetical protein
MTVYSLVDLSRLWQNGALIPVGILSIIDFALNGWGTDSVYSKLCGELSSFAIGTGLFLAGIWIGERIAEKLSATDKTPS